jgi:AbrB family looped-hinge helix DNA binding protein
MHKVSVKRQVTIPKDLCDQAGIQPGDMVEIFEYDGRVTVIKKESGASAGVLKHLKGDASVTDEDSLQDTLAHKHPRKDPRKRKRRTA